MMGLDFSDLMSQQMIIAALTMVAVAGTVFVLVMPLLEGDKLKSRMKSVALERDQMRARERARMADEKANARVSLRNQPKQQVQRIVDRLNLKHLMSDEQTKLRLIRAGYRGTKPLYMFLFARLVMPVVLFFVALFYTFVVLQLEQPPMVKVLIASVVAFIGYYAPDLYLKNKIQNRQLSIRPRLAGCARPDADLRGIGHVHRAVAFQARSPRRSRVQSIRAGRGAGA
jgi:tight adherence protein C